MRKLASCLTDFFLAVKLAIYKCRRKIKKKILRIPYKGLRKYDLIIYDDIYPHPMSGFRLEEFTTLLHVFKKSKIIVNPLAYKFVNSNYEQHIVDVKQIEKDKPVLKGKIRNNRRFWNINTKLFYCVFYINIYENLSWIEKYKIPFVFTLYPGGGFQINDKETDKRLRQIFSSPMFGNVIVTQKYTRDYLIDKKLCPLDKIIYIFGGVVPQNSIPLHLDVKYDRPKTKKTFDICFCAAKYTPKGKDKGYDVFIDVAHKLSKEFEFTRYHVIGGFASDDIDVSGISEKITFYGYQNFQSLQSIFKNIDLILSPNRSFILNNNQFDGFPLGTVVEAVFNGVVGVVTDDLMQNEFFTENEEIIIVDCNVDEIVSVISDLVKQPEKMSKISNAGREKFLKIYSNSKQMKPRIKLLKTIIDE